MHDLSKFDLQNLLYDTNNFICVLDLDGKLLFSNNSPLKAAGIGEEDVLGKKFCDCFWFNYDAKVQSTVQKDCEVAATGKSIVRELLVQMREGLVWVEFRMHPVLDKHGNVYQLVPEWRDITNRKKVHDELIWLNTELEKRVKIRTSELEIANKKLKDLSEIDPLTKISNRRAYGIRIINEIASAKRVRQHLALLIIDIDCFKAFNDNYGHDSGDHALCSVALTISESIPRATDHASRYGGEEFVVLLQATDIQGAYLVAERIRTNINALAIEHQYSDVTNHLTVSIGLASLQGDEIDEKKLLKRADSALYLAKQKGKNQCVYE